MNAEQLKQHVSDFWEQEILPTISDYIRIPNKSPLYEPKWQEPMNKAVELVRAWVERQQIPNSSLRVVQLKDEKGNDRTPVLLLEVAGEPGDPILLYGHLDKQPEFSGWEPGLGPWEPVLRDGKLYGRGGADDGYAIFAVVSAIKALHAQKAKHPRLVALIECCEESGSYDLPFYVDHLAPQIGTPGLVVCLDSGCGNYEQLWTTTSLRGMMAGDLTVEVLREGVHSGSASGIVPSSFRVVRQLLSRLEDPETGRIVPEWLHAEIPPNRVEEAKITADVLGDGVFAEFPFAEGVRPMHSDRVQLLLNRTWRPTLSITGQAGMPELATAGNVLRPKTSLKLSIRLPPTLPARGLSTKLKELLTKEPPYGAKVSFNGEKEGAGWEAPATAPWLARAMDESSRIYFGKGSCSYGEGGSIPFMGMLGEKFPAAQFMITGVLGPKSNAHGPNEFLHIQTGKNVTACVAHVIASYLAR